MDMDKLRNEIIVLKKGLLKNILQHLNDNTDIRKFKPLFLK
jgi:hypothetical protein